MIATAQKSFLVITLKHHSVETVLLITKSYQKTMANKVPCPNEDCDNGIVTVKTSKAGHRPPKAKCSICKGTGWIIKKETEEE